MKVGRNDPCPCGSGKKYKPCCLASERAVLHTPEELLWRRLRRECEGFPARMFNFVVATYGVEAVLEAWDEFNCCFEHCGEFDPESRHIPVFMPWMFHRWAPEADASEVEDRSLHGVKPTRAYLIRKGRHLDPLHRAYLEQCLQSPFSFLEVLASRPGRGLEVREVVSGDAFHVWESSASGVLTAGDLLYAQPVEVQGVVTLEGCSSIMLPPARKVDLLRLRNEVRSDYEQRGAGPAPWEEILREYYLEVANELLDPHPPRLQNTDGHDLAPQTLEFAIDDAAESFERLAHLSVLRSRAELLADAELDPDGRVRALAFDWHRLGNAVHASWDSTILGHLRIADLQLSLEVNSDERASEGRRLIETALGDRVRYLRTVRGSLEGAAARGGMAVPDGDAAPDPALRALMDQLVAAHYETWPELPLPSLAGRTPQQAIATPDGRELVEALVEQIARGSPSMPPVPAGVVEQLRRRLGLA